MTTFNFRNPCLAALSALALTPLAALAAGSANINYDGESGQLYWQNAQTVRMDMAADPGHILMKNNKVYMVHLDAPKGMPQVMEMSGILQTFSGLADQDGNMLEGLSQNIQSARNTGASETIAGITGEVYDITIKDSKGNVQTRQLVLSNDAIAQELTEALFGVSGSLVGTEYLQPFKQALPKGMYGVLRIDSSMVVQSINRNAPAASTFDLPAEPVNFGNMMKQLMEQATQQ